MNPPSQQDFQRAVAVLAAFQRPLLVSHGNPDGDALGSLCAMASFLRRRGAEPVSLIYEPLADRFAAFERLGSFAVLDESVSFEQLDACDGVVILDTCARAQLEPVAEWLERTDKQRVVFDHHATRDPVADVYLVDVSAAATCQLLFEFAQAVGWPVDEVARDALFIGLATDTGWFRFSNADAAAFAVAAALTKLGVESHRLYRAIQERESPGAVHLLGRSLANLELCAGNRVAVMTLSPSDFAAAGATPAETESIVNEPMRIATVQASVILVDRGEGLIRVSLRSKPPLAPDDADVNVAAIAHSLGGGGHRRAAGARIQAGLTEAKEQVIKALVAALGG